MEEQKSASKFLDLVMSVNLPSENCWPVSLATMYHNSTQLYLGVREVRRVDLRDTNFRQKISNSIWWPSCLVQLESNKELGEDSTSRDMLGPSYKHSDQRLSSQH